MSTEYTTSERLNQAIEEIECALSEARGDDVKLYLLVSASQALQLLYQSRHMIAQAAAVREVA